MPEHPDVTPAPDLSALERIEAELFAVERALEQIDQGVYDGFAGLDAVVRTAEAEAELEA